MHSTPKVSYLMISPETRAQIRRYFYVEGMCVAWASSVKPIVALM